jgi:hypothetical protein
MNPDQQNTLLRICSIFHYVLGGFLALVSCIPGLYLLFGLFMIMAGFATANAPAQNPPGFGQILPFFVVGGVFITISGAMVLIGFTLAFFIIITGRKLMGRRHYGFCLTMAAIECLFMPLGTILGVLTIILISHHDLKEAFIQNKSS